MLVYVAATSRLLDRPQNIAVVSQSAAGKNATVDAALELIPPDAIHREKAGSARALIYQWHATRRQRLVEEAWVQCGLLVHQTIIWVKSRGVLTRSHYMWQHEPCFYGWVEGNAPKLKPPASERTVWHIDQVGEQSGYHPTQKPVELFLRPIEFHTRPGDIVYEPFSGSGTQLIAAERTGRICCAMEQGPRYVQVAVSRWEAFSGEKAVREPAS